MEISPVLALTIGGGFTVILMLSAVLIVFSERRARTARVQTPRRTRQEVGLHHTATHADSATLERLNDKVASRIE